MSREEILAVLSKIADGFEYDAAIPKNISTYSETRYLIRQEYIAIRKAIAVLEKISDEEFDSFGQD